MSYSRRELYAFGEPLGESVTRKESGRMIYGGGGGGGGSSAPEAPPPPPPPPPRMTSAAPPPAFTTYGSGDRTGSLVQAGGGMRPSALDYSKPIYDPNYADNITGYQQSSQFYQPIYKPQYNNYANPLTAGSVAAYGTNPGPSAGYLAATAQGGQGLDSYYQGLRNFGAQQSSQPYGMDYATFNPARKTMGASQSDLMAAYNYNPMQGGGGLTPEMARTLMQRSMTSSGVPTSEFQKFGGYDTVKALYDKSGGDYSGQGNPYPQQQFNPYTNQYQTPFSYQQPQYQQQQMQTPFSYQQPMQQMQQPMAQPNYGPSQAIVGRSSQMRGTPNVMRRAEGGITSLLKKDK